MNLQGITGIGNVERRPAIHAANIVTMAVGRNAFLLMLRTNILGIASIMNLKSARSWTGNRNIWLENLKRLWYNLGGTNFDSLEKAFQAGSTKRAIGIKLVGKLPEKWISKYLNQLRDAVNFYRSRHNIDIAPKGIGAEPVTTTGATVIAALPVILQILQILTADQKPLNQKEQDELLRQYGTSQEEVVEEIMAEKQKSSSPFSTENLVKFGIPAAIALGAIYFITKK
jgi:hypothetical protein